MNMMNVLMMMIEPVRLVGITEMWIKRPDEKQSKKMEEWKPKPEVRSRRVTRGD